ARVHDEHRAILTAFERHDGEAAAEAVVAHLERVKRSVRTGEPAQRLMLGSSPVPAGTVNLDR
ncbi:MAG: hypothetical protein ACYC1C_08360, partial [Chloroflexota bacterium]